MTFKYDAFGRCTVSGDTTLAEYCRIRYRGYYYDTQTGLYWVQTRYYNPDWCRWISPDSISYLDPETPHGLNLYLYCANDPISFFDPTGHNIVLQFCISVGCYIGIAIASIWNKEVRADMEAIGWNPFNSDENKVMSSKHVSFYKGVPVFQISGGKGSMSLGAIFFDKSQGVKTLMHERGHNTQLMAMGLGNYLIQIGIPSLWKNGDETPWELSASIFGGSTMANKGTEEQQKIAQNYFIISMIPIVNIINILYYILY